MSSPTLFFALLLIACHCSSSFGKNNACSNILVYSYMQFSRKCWHNNDVGKSTEEIIAQNNFKFESYKVTTDDQYILCLIRLPGKGKPHLLLHGIFSDSHTHVSIGNSSLAFQLNSQGYDVYIGAFRGTICSNQHVNKQITKREYWDFCVQDVGFYDIPAFLDKVSDIRQKSGLAKEKVVITTWAMGCTATTFYSALNTTHANENVEAHIALSPLIYFNNVRNPFTIGICALTNWFKYFTHPLGINYIGISNENDKDLIYNFCLKTPIGTNPLCTYVTYTYLDTLVDPEALPMILTGFGATALRHLEHFGQLLSAEKQLKYCDRGQKRNTKVYGQNTPPTVDLSKINVKMRLIHGGRDDIATDKDVENAVQDLKGYGVDITSKRMDNYRHIDFAYHRHNEEFLGIYFDTLKYL